MTTPAGTLRFADRYRVLRRLGAGGMARVYLAEDERLGRRVALKVLHADSPEDVARRFEREARLGASLNHPNLVAVYDTVADEESVLIVMEYVDGPTLAQVVRDGPLPPPRAVEVLRGVAAALDHAHAHGIVHRDVKPANILLGEDGRAKLADLGIAFAAEHATHITRTGTVLGTPSYMAPEQLEGREVGPPVDVYALGAVAFEALSGRKARSGATPVEIAHRIATETAPELREAWPEAPPAAAEALCAAMAADPAERPPSAAALVERLASALAHAEAPTAATRRMGEGAAGAASGAAGGGAGSSATSAEVAGAPAPEPEAEAEAAPAAPPAASGPSGAPAPATGRRRPTSLVPAALLAGLVAIAAVVVLSLGGNGRESTSTGGGAGGGDGAASGTGGGGSGAGASRDPAGTVKAFYDRAAADDYTGAWALAAPSFRQQLGGFDSFQRTMSTLESIDFKRDETFGESGDTAGVSIETVAHHTNRVDHCQGTLGLTRAGAGGWLISGASISCSTEGGAGGG